MARGEMDGNGWEEWRNHVLCELRRFNAQQMSTATDITMIKQAIAELRVKADMRSAAIASTISLIGLCAMVIVEKFF